MEFKPGYFRVKDANGNTCFYNVLEATPQENTAAYFLRIVDYHTEHYSPYTALMSVFKDSCGTVWASISYTTYLSMLPIPREEFYRELIKNIARYAERHKTSDFIDLTFKPTEERREFLRHLLKG